MNGSYIKMKKVLWLEDQFEDLIDYSSCLDRMNYKVDPVKSVSDALEKLEKEQYDVYVFDLKVLPGDDPEWQALDEKKRNENPHFDPYLGFELLRFLDNARQRQSEVWKKITFDFSKVIVFSVVSDREVYDKLESFGIPLHQIVYKSSSDLDTLAEVVQEMEGQLYEEE